MQASIHVPELGAGPIHLSLWFADRGDFVYEGDRLVEILVAGATFDVAAPATGTLKEKWAHPDQRVDVGQTLGVVETEESSP